MLREWHLTLYSSPPSLLQPDIPAAEGTAANGTAPSSAPTYSLFAFPAYDNFSGKISPAEWVKAVQAKSTAEHEWRVIWDTAAFAPCHPVSLREVPADFICISL